MFKINYKGSDYDKIEKKVSVAVDCVSKFFEVKNYSIVVNIINSREEFDKIYGEKTANWIVGNSDNNVVNIFSPAAMGKQGNHKSTEFQPILIHELTHSFLNKVTVGKFIPVWLNEGLAAYVSKQHQDSEKIYYIDDDFCRQLGTYNGWDKNVKYGAYKLAALFVNFLISKYSFESIKKLLNSLDKVYYYKNFQKIIFNVYGKTINELEDEFFIFINKKNDKSKLWSNN